MRKIKSWDEFMVPSNCRKDVEGEMRCPKCESLLNHNASTVSCQNDNCDYCEYWITHSKWQQQEIDSLRERLKAAEEIVILCDQATNSSGTLLDINKAMSLAVSYRAKYPKGECDD